MLCRHWGEYDDSKGDLFEWCKAKQKVCYCSATESQCNFPEEFETDEQDAKAQDLLRQLGGSVAGNVDTPEAV